MARIRSATDTAWRVIRRRKPSSLVSARASTGHHGVRPPIWFCTFATRRNRRVSKDRLQRRACGRCQRQRTGEHHQLESGAGRLGREIQGGVGFSALADLFDQRKRVLGALARSIRPSAKMGCRCRSLRRGGSAARLPQLPSRTRSCHLCRSDRACR